MGQTAVQAACAVEDSRGLVHLRAANRTARREGSAAHSAVAPPNLSENISRFCNSKHTTGSWYCAAALSIILSYSKPTLPAYFPPPQRTTYLSLPPQDEVFHVPQTQAYCQGDYGENLHH